MDVVRWKLKEVETGVEHTLELNPNQAGSITFPREYTFSRHDSTRFRGIRQPRRPRDWTFAGVIRTKQHHDSILEWYRKAGKVRVTDHLDRTVEVMVNSLELTDRRPVGDDAWRFAYTFHCLLLRRIS